MTGKKKYETLHIESGDYETTLNRTYLSRKPWEKEDPNKILSFMPGTVEKLNVKKGSKVKQGEVMMVFRAMKMNNNILAPFDAKVKSINVSEGDNLPKNAVMLELE